MHLAYPVVLSALLFCVGVYGVLARRNAILVLMSVELMLNGANLNLVSFDLWRADVLHAGQVMALFVIVFAAAWLGILTGRRLPFGPGGVALAGTGASLLMAIAVIAIVAGDVSRVRET